MRRKNGRHVVDLGRACFLSSRETRKPVASAKCAECSSHRATTYSYFGDFVSLLKRRLSVCHAMLCHAMPASYPRAPICSK